MLVNGLRTTTQACGYGSRLKAGTTRHCEEHLRRSNPAFVPRMKSWIASRSLSSGAHSRDPLARNDVEGAWPQSNITHRLAPSLFGFFRVAPHRVGFGQDS